jgi:hypothetical protein
MNIVHLVAKYIFTSKAGCSENFSSFFRFIRVDIPDTGRRQPVPGDTGYLLFFMAA